MVNTIDLFAGCGGFTEGFKQTGKYQILSCVEWDKAPLINLKNRLKTKWKYNDVEERVLYFDIQRTEELINGWNNDKIYSKSKGLDYIVKKNGGKVDLIIGGPPCQAYSIAGRIRDENGMKEDYRNYLFESYLNIVKYFRPKAFIFENVPGMLSAKPGDGERYIVDIIKEQFFEAGYSVLDNLKEALVNFEEYGVPQKRSRVIILGLDKNYYHSFTKNMLDSFYFEILPKHKVSEIKTLRGAIGGLPRIYPLKKDKVINGKKHSHFCEAIYIKNHEPRYSNKRDMEIFKLLAEDIENKMDKYSSSQALKYLYTEMTGKKSNIHKYHVLRWDEPSNTIPAHLYKDGLRHIHPDSKQQRTITVREAARLQTFPDDYEFISGATLNYKMIGNAVPPVFAEKLAQSLYSLLFIE